MLLLKSVLKHHLPAMTGIILLNLLSACLGIFTISYINQSLVQESSPQTGLAKLAGLLIALLLVTLAAQWTLTALGHHFIWKKRSRMVLQLLGMSPDRLEQQGHGELLSMLGPDIRNITLAFVRLPELIQGIVLGVVAIGYLGYLSLPVLAIVMVWMGLTFYSGYRMVARVYLHLREVRNYETDLQDVFQVVIHGNKELALDPARARHFYENDYQQAALGYRQHIIRADSFHLSAINWSNIMMLGLIGLIFLASQAMGWISGTVATSFSLTVLFLRSPLLQAIGAWPTLLSGELAFKKIGGMLAADQETLPDTDVSLPAGWQTLRWENLSWHYPQSGFSVGPVTTRLNRGEIVFIIGANGSGKSTLSQMLTGLYASPGAGVWLDDQPLTTAALKSLFSVVFTRPYLFRTVFVSPESEDDASAELWLDKLGLAGKVSIENNQLSTLDLSQGQKKRVALLLALAARRDILFLDEWAAEQDPQFRRYFYRELLPWFRAQGKTLMIISHDDDYFDVADRVLEMHQGQLRELTAEQRDNASRDVISQLGR
ncbi:multidrug ABC transporter permease/ATP-binding protein [Tatumella sp. JGM118]|uniref:ABC-type xenobiotic transporter n=1 Tax=Tatumella terrea TaxID=419007 RepID=A0ABW1W3K7_9GAMM|nr:multidrug ABC transporter permease/ATP-binding protein [Tatumella sp. JGM118]MBS0908580.1 multidrug ABC transporter permease/ATP-binding protein [Tatumella sp. JGM118]